MESEIKKKYDKEGGISISYLMRKYKINAEKADQIIKKLFPNKK